MVGQPFNHTQGWTQSTLEVLYEMTRMPLMKVGHAYDTSIVKGVHDELTSKATHLLLEKKQVYEKSAENKDMV